MIFEKRLITIPGHADGCSGVFVGDIDEKTVPDGKK